MCSPDSVTSSGDAVAAVEAGLGWLAAADATGLTADEQAGCLQALERAESRLTAARASVLTAFTAARAFEADGQGGPRSWLRFRTRITRGAAAGAAAWMRRLAAHPAVADALAAAALSGSWARHVCEWTDLLPEASRADADRILLAAAASGAELADLAALAEEIRLRCAEPDNDSDDDGFGDRYLRLDPHYRGAGKLDADLTPQCATALQAVLDALGRKQGAEDTRTRRQRDHDALEEACRRLIGAGTLPDRAGQPTQILLHMSLDQLRGAGGSGAAGAEAAWAAAQGGASAPAPPGADCDAAIVPVVSGHVDPDVLDSLAAALLARRDAPDRDAEGRDSDRGDPDRDAPGGGARGGDPGRGDLGGRDDRAAARQERLDRAVRQLILRHAASLMSGPGGLAAYLRTGLADRLTGSVPLPLDIGAVTDTIPVHLRRAVTSRDRRCRFPGCDQPPAACQPHHITPRCEGGPTSLANLILMCSFHHLIAIHRWGWAIALHPDGTLTATSPDRQRTLHDHGPPAHAA